MSREIFHSRKIFFGATIADNHAKKRTVVTKMNGLFGMGFYTVNFHAKSFKIVLDIGIDSC